MININLTPCDEPEKQINEYLEVLNKIEADAISTKNLTINMKDLRWILPCSALLISHKIRDLCNEGYTFSFIEPEEKRVRAYLSTVGFPLGGGKAKTTYMPIHHFPNNEKDPTKTIDSEINAVFEIVRKHFPEEPRNSIFYLLGELTDNIDQHSKYTMGSIMVQFFKEKGFIDIGVLDNGLTIPGVYEKNKIEFSDDCNALSKALRGITTKEGEIGRGKGLETSKKLVIDGLEGDFYILSRKGAYINKSKEKPFTKNIVSPLKGTLVYTRFKLPKKDLNIYDYVE